MISWFVVRMNGWIGWGKEKSRSSERAKLLERRSRRMIRYEKERKGKKKKRERRITVLTWNGIWREEEISFWLILTSSFLLSSFLSSRHRLLSSLPLSLIHLLYWPFSNFFSLPKRALHFFHGEWEVFEEWRKIEPEKKNESRPLLFLHPYYYPSYFSISSLTSFLPNSLFVLQTKQNSGSAINVYFYSRFLSFHHFFLPSASLLKATFLSSFLLSLPLFLSCF